MLIELSSIDSSLDLRLKYSTRSLNQREKIIIIRFIKIKKLFLIIIKYILIDYKKAYKLFI